MRRYPTQKQFSEHVCTHWEMLDTGEEGCAWFGKGVNDPTLPCNPQCPAYDPWDITVEELLEADGLPDGEQTKNGGAT